MDVEYEQTPEDIIAFNRYHQKHLPALQRRIEPVVAWALWIICILFGFALMAAFAFGVGAAVVPLLFAGWFGAWIASVGIGWQAKRSVAQTVLRALQCRRDAEKVLGWQRVLLDKQGVSVESRFFTSFFRWNSIDHVATTDEYIFIYVMTYNAQLIPLRAFADGRAFDAFVDAAKRYYALAGVGEMMGEGGERERRRPTGIQTADSSPPFGTVEGIVPKASGL